jgi:stage II sporulation protein GA (sporulation sigma-E factor processing peptidase)
MTVYADVLIVVNLFVNYALLLCTSLILKNRVSNLRLLIGALIGSLYGLVIFLPKISIYIELPMRIAVSMLIVLASFGYKNMRRFLRCFFTLFAVTFAFGGIMLVLWVTVAPVGMIYNNGTVYFDIDLSVLAISTVVCFALVSLISRLTARKAPTNSIYNITVTNNDKKISGVALCDTGNSLVESFSGFPVVIGEYESLISILPQSIVHYYENPSASDDAENFRLIVCKTVSDVGLLPSFRPKKMEISSLNKKITTDEVYIAVTKNRIGAGEFDFIINPKIFDGVNSYENNRENKKAPAEIKAGKSDSLYQRSGNTSSAAVKAGRTGGDR